jgi:hypothetical protein
MAKGNILQDTFEQLAELGQSTAKKTVKSVAQTFNPLATPEKSGTDQQKAMSEKLKNQRNNHTPLDFKRLQEQYQNNDSNKTDTLRRHLFNLVKRADEKTLMDSRQKEMQKKRQEAYTDSDKKRREEERKKSMSDGDGLPKGKQRKSIFSHKKAAEKQHAETKPSTGKQ